jgi:hypothetical protein
VTAALNRLLSNGSVRRWIMMCQWLEQLCGFA